MTTIQYLEAGRPSSILYIGLTCLIAVVVSFVLTFILGFRDPQGSGEAATTTTKNTTPKGTQVQAPQRLVVNSPMTGKLMPLSQVSDETFASGVLGTGCGHHSHRWPSVRPL